MKNLTVSGTRHAIASSTSRRTRMCILGIGCLAILVATAYASGGGEAENPVITFLKDHMGESVEITEEFLVNAESASGRGSENSTDFVLMVVFATVAIGFSFLCSIAEAVVLSVTPSYIANLKNEGKPGADRLDKVKSNIDQTLAGILTLNTIAHTVGSGGAGAYAAKYYGQNSVGVAMAVLTLLILFLSEIVPKTIGANYWRILAPSIAVFVQMLTVVLYPLIWVSEQITKLLTGGKKFHVMTREEFTALADIGAAAGQLDLKESRIVKNLLRFPDLRAIDIMTPRTVVFALQQDQTVAESMDKIKVTSFSRIPIYGENRDDVTGFILKTDALLNERTSDGKSRLRDLKRELVAVEDTTTLSEVLEELLDNRTHLILVVDKYGGMQGIVTLEDVVETLFGIEILDEVDKTTDMRALARAKWEERMARVGIDVRHARTSPDAPEAGRSCDLDTASGDSSLPTQADSGQASDSERGPTPAVTEDKPAES